MSVQTLENIVTTFAKENKYSRVKLQSLADQIVATMQQPRQGKPVSEISLHVREMLRGKKGQTFTSKSLAEKLGINPVIINNNLRYLQQKEKIAMIVGKERTSARGKPSLVWQIA